jgi:hypothetical protein
MGPDDQQQSPVRNDEMPANGEFGGLLDRLATLLAILTLIIMVLLVVIIASMVLLGGT